MAFRVTTFRNCSVIALATAFLAWYGPSARPATPGSADGASNTELGQRLAATNGCVGCHSPQKGPPLSGNMVGPWFAPNITPDSISGIGAWSRAEIVQYLRTGKVPGRAQAAGPMAQVVEALQATSDAALEALAAWLASQPPVRDPADQVAASERGNPLPAAFADEQLRGSLPEHPDAMLLGASVFSGSCTTCHMPDGGGSSDGYVPSLFHNSAVGRRNPANLLAVLLTGVQRTAAGQSTFMPGFDGSVGMPGGLSDPQLVAVANYVLAKFGDPAAAKITTADIEAARAGR